MQTCLPLPRAIAALNPRPVSRLAFLEDVRELVLTHTILEDETRQALKAVKLVYGKGDGSYRGICCFEAWSHGKGKTSLVEIAASGEESVTQLVGTLIHELAHVLAGKGQGHNNTWAECCSRLGLLNAQASGQVYKPEEIKHWHNVLKLERPNDGTPELGIVGSLPWIGLPVFKAKPCPMGIGVRGGTSRGVGSGSRLVLWLCSCPNPPKVRAAMGSRLNAKCNVCGSNLEAREDKSC